MVRLITLPLGAAALLALALTTYQVSPVSSSSLPVELSVRDAPHRFPPSAQTLPRALREANVVYLGETHNQPDDHAAQLSIIQKLYRENPNLAIAMEMFQRPFQPVIDSYLAGQISAAELRRQSEYDQRWGYPWSYYEPILEFAKLRGVPVLAANTPAEITQQVAREGLEGLAEDDFQWIPPVSEIRTDNDAYREWIRQVYDGHGAHGSSRNFDNFFLAQVLWDETMAESVAQFLVDNPTHQVIVLAGQGHIMYGYGIPSRVTRRVEADSQWKGQFSQATVLLNPSQESRDRRESEDGEAIADYFWFHAAPEQESRREL
ncbi:MAG: ChaN family lipoprotein [Synechococcales bacterium]|nr:ChaN family lipoprotein [Synechococcales bacterium]